jgi:hypothetical protein
VLEGVVGRCGGFGEGRGGDWGWGREEWVPWRFEEWGVAVVRERRRRVERVKVVGTCMVGVWEWIFD